MTRPQEPTGRSSRRARRTRETYDEIKTVALRQLTETGGPVGVSMRGIARELDMTASGVHYYYDSREELLEALVVDGFTSLSVALRQAYQRSEGLSTDDRWLAVAFAFRGWALEQPAHYMLIYGHTGGRVVRIAPPIGRALGLAVAVLFELIRDCHLRGQLDLPRLEAQVPASMRAELEAWRASTPEIADLPDGALAACMLCYSRLHGAVALELVGHLPPPLADHDTLFELQMRHTADALHP